MANKSTIKILAIIIWVYPAVYGHSGVDANFISTSGPNESTINISHSSPRKVTTVALLPFHCRAGSKYADISTAISLVAGDTIMRSGQVAIVDREQIEKVFNEKAMAAAGLTDKVKLAEKGSMIGADYIVSGYYDIIDEKLVIVAELIPSDKSDVGWTPMEEHGDFKKVKSAGEVSESISVIENFATELRDSLPGEGKLPTIENLDFKPDPAQALAVFDFVAVPANERNISLSMALTELTSRDLQEVLPVSIVEREQIKKILQEHQLHLAGFTNRAHALQLGKLVGADYILLGSVLSYGQSARLDVHLLDVVSGTVITTAYQSGHFSTLLTMHRELAINIAEYLGASLKRLDWLRERRIGTSIEAMTQAGRAYDIFHFGKGKMEKRKKQAEQLIKLALDLDPNNQYAQHYGAHIAYELGNIDEAEKRIRRAVEIDPESHWHNRCLSSFLRKVRQDPNQALAYAQRAVDLAPRHCRGSRWELAECLYETGQITEAEKECKAVCELDQGPEMCELMAKILEKQNKHGEAAKYYELTGDFFLTSGDPYLRKARQLWEKAGEHDRAMGALEKLVEHGVADNNEKLELAECLSKHNPPRAAALCYYLSSNSEQDVARKALNLLKDMGMPPKPILPTGPVFDIRELRKKEVHAFLQQYEGFKFPGHLLYLKTYLEDTLGIPVEISSDVRPLPAANYNKAVDIISPDNHFEDDLEKVRVQTKSVAIIGLVSIRMMNKPDNFVSWVRWNDNPCGIVSTYLYQPPEGASEYLISPVTLCKFQRGLLQCLTRILPPERIDHGCITGNCSLGASDAWRSWRRDATLCEDCRRYVQAARKEWPVGVIHRSSFVVGPKIPVFKSFPRKIFLIVLGLSNKDANFDVVAECITSSTGIGVKTVVKNELPSFQRYDYGWSHLPDLITHAATLVPNNEVPAAICVITDDKIWDPHTGLLWEMSIIDFRSERLETKCPVIALNMRGLPNRFKRLETVSWGSDNTELMQVPQYGKLIVGALAIASKKEHQCWTYGCPATVWEGIGIPHRCSYWLCPVCREGVEKYYGNITAK